MRSSSATETTFGVVAALTGIGIVTFALFPLSLPILILTAASLLPLLAVGLAVAIPVALIAAVALAIRAIFRRAAGGRDSVNRDERRGGAVSAVAGRG
jgi:membrane protein implicated in regulation of membrane protease activity